MISSLKYNTAIRRLGEASFPKKKIVRKYGILFLVVRMNAIPPEAHDHVWGYCEEHPTNLRSILKWTYHPFSLLIMKCTQGLNRAEECRVSIPSQWQ